jgi:predicted nicotinamide N-methyase
MALPIDAIEEVVVVSGHDVVLSRPRDSERLIDEAAFLDDERLPYWAELWPVGVVLASTIVGRSLRGRRVLELGCGLGLASICAALAGGRVTASDWFDQAVELAADNAARNGVAVEPLACSWQRPEPLIVRAPWDLVLAADVLYERRNLSPLLALLPKLVDERGEIWLADPGRQFTDEFLAGARSDGWLVDVVTRAETPRAIVYSLRRR